MFHRRPDRERSRETNNPEVGAQISPELSPVFEAARQSIVGLQVDSLQTQVDAIVRINEGLQAYHRALGQQTDLKALVEQMSVDTYATAIVCALLKDGQTEFDPDDVVVPKPGDLEAWEGIQETQLALVHHLETITALDPEVVLKGDHKLDPHKIALGLLRLHDPVTHMFEGFTHTFIEQTHVRERWLSRSGV